VPPDDPDQNPDDGGDGGLTQRNVEQRAIPTISLVDLSQQRNAPSALKVISQPTDVPNLADIASYAYQNEPVGQVRIYIIDSGADPQSDVSGSCMLRV
jgi:hypothetical protein